MYLKFGEYEQMLTLRTYTVVCLSREEVLFLSLYSVHCAGLLDVQNILSADTAISRQTEGHSFCDHLISESVSVTPSIIIEASVVLCSVSL
jgi:hypothetical protein